MFGESASWTRCLGMAEGVIGTCLVGMVCLAHEGPAAGCDVFVVAFAIVWNVYAWFVC